MNYILTTLETLKTKITPLLLTEKGVIILSLIISMIIFKILIEIVFMKLGACGPPYYREFCFLKITNLYFPMMTISSILLSIIIFNYNIITKILIGITIPIILIPISTGIILLFDTLFRQFRFYIPEFIVAILIETTTIITTYFILTKMLILSETHLTTLCIIISTIFIKIIILFKYSNYYIERDYNKNNSLMKTIEIHKICYGIIYWTIILTTLMFVLFSMLFNTHIIVTLFLSLLTSYIISYSEIKPKKEKFYI